MAGGGQSRWVGGQGAAPAGGAVPPPRPAGLLAQALPAFVARLTSRAPFETQLAAALAEARRTGAGFYLGGLAARRALGAALVIEADPRRIDRRLRHRVETGGRTLLIRDRFLGAGDWTPLIDPLDDASTYRDAQEVVAAGLDYRRTRAYRTALERAAEGRPVERNFVALATPALVERYFARLAALVRSISEAGIVRRAEYRRMAHLFGDLRVRMPWVELAESDVGIAVGADGAIYRFAPGKHRTAIAQALGLATMPVEVRLVHADWLARQMEGSGLAPVPALIHGIGQLSTR